MSKYKIGDTVIVAKKNLYLNNDCVPLKTQGDTYIIKIERIEERDHKPIYWCRESMTGWWEREVIGKYKMTIEELNKESLIEKENYEKANNIPF